VAPRTGGAYLGTMRNFNLTKVSPIDVVGDFVHQWQQPTPYPWRINGQ
jgi:hypothetical protein